MTRGTKLCIGFLLLGVSFYLCNCQIKALGSSCTPPADDAANDECTTAVANLECKTDKCACKEGFIKESVACKKALGQACSDANECVSNSKCVGTGNSKTCSCKDGFASKEGLCSQTVEGTDCKTDTTACDNIDNAACDASTNKCKCNPNFSMNVGKCDPKSAASMTEFGAMTMAFSLVAARWLMF